MGHLSKADGKDSNEINFIKVKKQDYRNMFAGFISSFVSRTLTAPLDRLKMIYQVNYFGKNNKPPNIFNGLKIVLNEQGIKGLFRGNLINIIKGSPEVGIKLYCFELIKWKYQCYIKTEKLEDTRILIIASISGIISTTIIFPLEVLKLRIGATDIRQCKGGLKTFLNIRKEKGGYRNYYSGLEASIISSVPNAGILLYSYEKLKIKFSGGENGVDNAKNLSPFTIMILGAISALISLTILYPLQMTQARMIMTNLHNEINVVEITNKLVPFKNSKFLKTVNTIFHFEGAFGFYKGYKVAAIKTMLGNGIGFAVFEKTKLFLGLNKTI